MQTASKLPYRYTDKELRKLLKSLTVLIDTREQKADHIIQYLDKKKISYKNKKLDYGDYSFMLPKEPELGIMRDIYFNDEIAVERKRSLNEVSQNFCQGRTQFENELIRSKDGKMVLLIENVEGYGNIIKHNYRTDYKPKSYIGTLHAFRARYDIEVTFVDPVYSGNFIYYTFYYWLREYLK
ncbi:MAG: ERCC4 domain-containing protein [Halanaerobiales bacterium]|nr:ERCC4 domain-containing protein [Halanaerobiales bacterium]